MLLRLLFFIFLLLSSQLLSRQLLASDILFHNFSKQIVLTKQNNGQYRVNDSLSVITTNRIIAKAELGVTKQKIMSVSDNITAVSELYRLENSKYFLVNIDDEINLTDVMAQLGSESVIELVQPDLLQARGKSSAINANRVTRTTTDYLSRLGIQSLWKSTKGRNTKVAIIDDGFDLLHEDLRALQVSFQYDTESQSLNSSPRTTLDKHGTQVAGIIFAQHNGIGIDGIAPEAEFIGIRDPYSWTSSMMLSFYLAKLAGADVVNCSWQSRFLLQPVAEVIGDLSHSGRGGLGTPIIFSAGNHNSVLGQWESEATLADVISVGSIDRNKKRLKFSNHGQLVSIYTYGKFIKTTSAKGNRDYVLFTGTSASAPIVSGVVALLLSQEPTLTLNDIKARLAHIFN